MEEMLENQRKTLAPLIERNGSNPTILEDIIAAVIPKARYRMEGAQIGYSTHQGILLPNIALSVDQITSSTGSAVDPLLEENNLKDNRGISRQGFRV